MTGKYNPRNERIKKEYLRYLAEAEGRSGARRQPLQLLVWRRHAPILRQRGA